MSLQPIIDEFNTASDRFNRLVQSLPLEQWSERNDPDRWSVAECVEHLNMSTEQFRDRVEEGLKQARAAKSSSKRLKRDLVGWILYKTLRPPVRTRFKTPAAYVPDAQIDPQNVIDRFRRYQDEQLNWVRAAEGLPIDKIKIESPFDPRVKYNLYSCLSTIPRHQLRHLWQAEQVWKDATEQS